MNVSVEQAQSSLPELIEKSARGERIVITRGQPPEAALVPISAARPSPTFGACAGMLKIVSEDEAHLDDFKEYMR